MMLIDCRMAHQPLATDMHIENDNGILTTDTW